jgi:NAD(P)H-quinone oxidoreductase subunit 5
MVYIIADTGVGATTDSINQLWNGYCAAGIITATTSNTFIIGWLALLIAVILLYIGTGEWTIDPSQNYDYGIIADTGVGATTDSINQLWNGYCAAGIITATTSRTIDPSQNYDYALNHGLKLVIDLLLVVAVIIPAAQYPFQSWLIEQ